MKFKLILLICLVQITFLSQAQVGVGTQNPNGIFHVDGQHNNTTTNDNRFHDDLVILANGNVGLGTLTPKVKLDLRNESNNNALGLGAPSDISLTASAAGAGAVKYFHTSAQSKGLKFSDGSTWQSRELTPIKTLVFANKGTSQTINANSLTNVTDWTTITDRNNNFDGTVFTANREANYIATFNVAFASATINNDSTIEVLLSSTAQTGIPQFRCVYSFPGTGSTSVSNIISGSCTGVFRLQPGQTIRPQVIQTVGGTNSRSILNDSSYNTLSITEL